VEEIFRKGGCICFQELSCPLPVLTASASYGSHEAVAPGPEGLAGKTSNDKGEDVPDGIGELKEHMFLAESIRNTRGLLLVAKGQEITLPLLTRLKKLVYVGIKEPIQVIVPIGKRINNS
jgi:hypothetical protein